MQKPILVQLKVGIIKGWNTPTLPPHIIDFQNKPEIRILRLLGGISLLLLLGKSHIHTPMFIKYIAIIITFVFFVLSSLYLIP